MKKYLLLICMLFAGTSLFAGQSDTLLVKTRISCDHCKKCESCQPRIEHELSFTKGVKSYRVNVDEQTITIIYNASKVSPEKIRQAIAAVGYDADDVKASPAAVARLDDCCKKK